MKAILVIEEPQHCIGCPLLDGDDDYCIPLKNFVPNMPPYGKRPDCPLRPLPQKYCTDGNDIEEDSYWMGWNECIDEILGETNG